MADTLTVVAKIRAKAGRGDELAAIFREQVQAVRGAEPDCLVYRVHRSDKDPGQFLFYEQYRSEAAFQAHAKSAHLAAFRGRREGMVDGPAEIEIYRALTD